MVKHPQAGCRCLVEERLGLRRLESPFVVCSDSNRHRFRSDLKSHDSNRNPQNPFESLMSLVASHNLRFLSYRSRFDSLAIRFASESCFELRAPRHLRSGTSRPNLGHEVLTSLALSLAVHLPFPISTAVRSPFVTLCLAGFKALEKGKRRSTPPYLYGSTPTICTAVRLPFVLRYASHLYWRYF